MSGQVFSFESVPRHMSAARRNYRRWRANWELIHGEGTWPDNVQFVEADGLSAKDHLASVVDAVSLCQGWLHLGWTHVLKRGDLNPRILTAPRLLRPDSQASVSSTPYSGLKAFHNS